MIVSEFIAWLQTQDQGATVEVLRFDQGNYGQSGCSRIDFDPVSHAEYIDLRGNQFAKGQPYENSRTLFLGEET